MIHNKEFRHFTIVYGITAGLVWLAALIGGWIFWECVDYGNRRLAIRYSLYLGIIVLLVEILLYGVAYYWFRRIYQKIAEVSWQINQCVVDDTTAIIEEYADGELGILQSNFHKLIQALQEAKEQEKKEKFFLKDIISDISHQLKTPLASLTIFIDLLAEGKLADKAAENKIIEEARNQLNRMEWMVLSLLKLARIEAGAITFEANVVSLKTLLLASVECLRVRYEQKEQQILVDCGETIQLCLDGEWLQEALVNIIKNAIDYTPEQGRIMVKAEETKIFTRIVVEDNGMGIAKKDLPYIFDRFCRGNNNANSNSVGIGLSLAKSIVEGQGGKIHVDSEEGKYTRFTITFIKGRESFDEPKAIREAVEI